MNIVLTNVNIRHIPHNNISVRITYNPTLGYDIDDLKKIIEGIMSGVTGVSGTVTYNRPTPGVLVGNLPTP